MKTLGAALLVIMLAGSGCAVKPVERPQAAGDAATLNAAVHYLDRVFVNALDSLALIATTPEAKGRDWIGIKQYLLQQQAGLPGVYFFVLPNGDYYSTEKDYTKLNLSNRPYFRSLFAGNQVKGYPVYSRSTGKKSAVVAVPILVDGRVVGALGISIFLDKLATRISLALGLPQNYTWFVLNAEGNTMLDQDPEYIFMNALTQGSPSLQEAITESLQHVSGKTEYKLETVRHADYRKLPNMDWWMFLVKVEGGKGPVPQKLGISLEHFVPELQTTLEQIDNSLKSRLAKSNVDFASEVGVRKLLGELLADNMYIVEAAYVDPNGILRYIEPGEYRNFENVDISAQAHTVAMRKNPRPLFSGGFMAVEDFLAVLDARPVFDKGKDFAGNVNLLIRPELLIDSLLKKSSIPDDYELWIMQTDGMIIYDKDRKEIGKMLFSDPMYEGYGTLRELGREIVAKPNGQGSYVFLAEGLKEKVLKEAIWQTVSLHNREWRVVLAYRPYE